VTRRASVATGGAQGNGNSVGPVVSALGRYVVFSSSASNLVPRDRNNDLDVFLHDRRTAKTERISENSRGVRANGRSVDGVISRLGHHVAFYSYATNLIDGDTNGKLDVFLHDRRNHSVSRVFLGMGGQQGNGDSFAPSLSADGRYVAFTSEATNLVPNDTNGFWDIFVRDRRLNRTSRVSVGLGGMQPNGESARAAISGNGRFVAFVSSATNLVPGDTNAIDDVFVHDRTTGVTTLVSDVGVVGIHGSDEPSISADGRYVAFSTTSQVDGFTLKVGIFVADRQTGTRTLVSVNDQGQEANDQSFFAEIAGDGRDVAFFSRATNLVPNHTNGAGDVFVRDR
jgi:Tol biopolymer transport system component